MKNRILYGLIAFVMALFVTGCSDDDYKSSTTPLLDQNSVTTVAADIAATSVTFHGTVTGLESQAASSYTTGFYYGTSETNLSEKITASSAAEFQASVSGMPGDVLYYKAFVTLQGKVTYEAKNVESAIFTNAKATTGEAKDITATTAVLTGTLEKAPEGAESGILISADNDNVRSGVRLTADELKDNYSVKATGLLPNTRYYYTAYLDLGQGVVYGTSTLSFVTPDANFNPDEDLVDLGLSTKWCKYNVGADKATDLGGLFGFGDMGGFNTSIDPADYASADIYKTDRDVANHVYGSWVTMPTIDEFEELFTECDVQWTEQDGVAGYKCTGPNGNSIFLPAAGSRTQGTISGIGTQGYYLSGSVNKTDNQFAMAYSFDQSSNRRTTTPVYQALAIRPVSTAKNVKFDKSLLYNTWEIDLREDGSHYYFDGPVYFYGADDSWASVTNQQPVVGDSWNWAAAYSDNAWVVNANPKNCSGSMTLNEDGTVKVVQPTAVADDGTVTTATYEGTYTVDSVQKTIKLTVAPLIPANYVGAVKETKNVDLRILSLSKSSMQMAVTRSSDNQTLGINYVTSTAKNGYKASLLAWGDGGDWNSATVAIDGGDDCEGKSYTVTFNAGDAPRTNGKVVCLDLQGFSTDHPNAIVRIDAIKADGKDVPFDGMKFYYGDIENNGNYRVEIFNCWGAGTASDNPFHKGGGNLGESESALAFADKLEVTFTVASTHSDGTGVYTPQLITINPSWGGTWGYDEGDTFTVTRDDHKYAISRQSFDLTYESSDHADGSIMTFVQIADIYSYFPTMHATLDELLLDGKQVSYDKAKVLDSSEAPKYRLELYNEYGTTAKETAFGTPESDGVLKGLAFSKSMETKFTIQSLFAQPAW